MPDLYDRMRTTVKQSAFAGGMLAHLDELSDAAVCHYLSEFLPALVRSSGSTEDDLVKDMLDMTIDVLREQQAFNQNKPESVSFDSDLYKDREFMERSYLNGLTLALLFWPNHWRILRYFEELVIKGHLYFLETPLFRVRNKKETRYCFSESERDEAQQALRGPETTRFKGLGEISPHEFAPFISNDMRIIPVVVHNIGEVTHCLDFFMGRNTPERKAFIIDNLATDVV